MMMTMTMTMTTTTTTTMTMMMMMMMMNDVHFHIPLLANFKKLATLPRFRRGATSGLHLFLFQAWVHDVSWKATTGQRKPTLLGMGQNPGT